MDKAEYKKYLQTDHWQELRRAKLKKRKDCEICGDNFILDIHHKAYQDWRGESYLYREPKGILKVLCRDCHFLYHRTFGKMRFGNRRHQRIKNLLSLGIDKREAFIIVAKGKYRNIYNGLQKSKIRSRLPIHRG